MLKGVLARNLFGTLTDVISVGLPRKQQVQCCACPLLKICFHYGPATIEMTVGVMIDRGVRSLSVR